jgi:hypothetical protein
MPQRYHVSTFICTLSVGKTTFSLFFSAEYDSLQGIYVCGMEISLLLI